MTKTLRIAKDLALPLDGVTQTFGAIGRKGAGKTYLAMLIAEQMLDAEAQVVAIDPVGNWWGLRVGADGVSKGKDIFVVGGEHGDVPLTPEAGAKIAQLIVEKRISAVLDVSAFRMGERKRFAAAFGEELFHLKKSQRTAVHVFIEEAQLFAPQRPGADEARMLGAFESIVRLGRNYGIGATLVTQRPQSVNKEVLSQVECLCVLQVNGTHERKALEEWVQEAGADRKLVGELPSLGRGEGYVWSPSWLRIFKRVHFLQKTTFDASATPEVGKAATAAKLSTVDVEALRADLAEVVKAAEQTDPKSLQRQIAQLRAELAKKPVPVAAAAAPKVVEKRVEVPVLKEGQLKRIEKMADLLLTAAAEADSAAKELRAITAPAVQPQPVQRVLVTRPAPRPPPPPRAAPAPRQQRQDLNGDAGEIPPAAMRMLECVVRRDGLSRRQLATLAGYTVSGGGFRNTLSELSTHGLVEKRGDHIFATTAGREYCPAPPAQLPEDVRGLWRGKLAPAAWRMLEVVMDHHPHGISRGELAQVCNYEVSGGGFRNTLSELSSNDLIEKDGDQVRAAEELIG